MPMFEGSVPSNLSFKKGCDKSCLKTWTPCKKLTQGKNTPHVDTVCNRLSHKGQVHHRHTQPMWYSLQRTLSHGTSTSQTTHSQCGTVRSRLSHTGQVDHRHMQPMWHSPQRTLSHGASTSQTHTAHVVQSAADSHAWGKYITDTHSPCGTVCSGLSRMGQVHHRHTQPMWYSLQRTLTHGTSRSQTYIQPMW